MRPATLLFLLPSLGLVAGCFGSECGPGTVDKDGTCVPVDDSGESDTDTDADTDTDTDADADADTDTDADTDIGTDLDGDGSPDGEDCDDNDAAIHPGADEICDGIDNDCNELVDEVDPDLIGDGPWYQDLDGDGYGDLATAVDGCSAPTDWVIQGGDCNDLSAFIHPDAPEVCDGIDNDCDGQTDDDDPGLDGSTGSEFFADLDGDGFGDPASSTWACEQPDDHAVSDTDCDDGDSGVNPAATEVCNNWVDDDCDGSANACGIAGGDLASVADSSLTYITGQENGEGMDLAGDWDGDGFDDLIVIDRGMVLTDGGAMIFPGPLPIGAVTQRDASLTLSAASSSEGVPSSVAWIGDQDGDGRDDFALGCPDDAGAGISGSGRVYLFLSTSTGSATVASADAVLEGWHTNQSSGNSLAARGDMDGDGRVDLVVGAPSYSSGPGTAYVLTTLPSGIQALRDVAAADVSATGDQLGWDVDNGGDVNGDGLADLLIGAPTAGWNDAGAAYLFFGPLLGSLDATDADSTAGGGSDYASGSSVAIPGDTDGDGYDDILVGAPGYFSAGGGLLWLGGVRADISGPWDVSLSGSSGSDAGYAVSTAGDVDGDGDTDLLIGAPEYNSGRGAAYLALAPLSGAMTSADMEQLSSSSTHHSAGSVVAGGGDLNGDGYDDIAVGAPYHFTWVMLGGGL